MQCVILSSIWPKVAQHRQKTENTVLNHLELHQDVVLVVQNRVCQNYKSGLIKDGACKGLVTSHSVVELLVNVAASSFLLLRVKRLVVYCQIERHCKKFDCTDCQAAN
jgi:hypothetical protein